MYSDEYTDDALLELEERINVLYETAHAELQVKLDNYLDGYTDERGIYHKGLYDRYLEQYEAYKRGLYTDEQFNAWWRAQVGRGTRWEAVRDASAQLLTYTNEKASADINDTNRKIYAENYNWSAYQIEGSMHITDEFEAGISFNLYDENTVRGLAESSIDLVKDKTWNRQRLQNAVMQGIIQGESISKIGERILFSDYSGAIKKSVGQVAYMNRNSAIRNARTYVTCAQNAGRQKSYEDATEMGISLKKQWLSAHDDRVRSSHRALDGITVPHDKPFPNGLMHPGDVLGSKSEVYNCRCTMFAVIKGVNDKDRDMFVIGDEGKWKVVKTSKTYEDYERWRDERIKRARPTTYTDATGRYY